MDNYKKLWELIHNYVIASDKFDDYDRGLTNLTFEEIQKRYNQAILDIDMFLKETETETETRNTVKPITPDEIPDRKKEYIPDFVFEAVNKLLVKYYNGGICQIKQSEIIDAILSKNPTLTRQDIYDNHYLDIEDVYRNAGWKVFYDKPGYNESYDAFFEFSKKK